MDGSLKCAQKIVVVFLRSLEMTFPPLALSRIGYLLRNGVLPQQYDGSRSAVAFWGAVSAVTAAGLPSHRKNGHFWKAEVPAELTGADASGLQTRCCRCPRSPWSQLHGQDVQHKEPLKHCLGSCLNRAGCIRDPSRPGWLSRVRIQLVKHAGNYLQ